MAPSETMVNALDRKVLLQHVIKNPKSLGLVPKTLLTQPNTGRRIVKRHELAVALHDALAELLVCEEGPESVAVASSFSTQGLKIFIAADRNKDLDLLGTQLRNVWSRLQEIKRIDSGADKSIREELVKIKDNEMEFRLFIYEYSWTKLMQRCEKYKDSSFSRFFEEVLDKSKLVTESLDIYRSDYVLSEELDAIRCLRGVCQLTDECSSEKVPDADGLNKLVSSIAGLNRLLKGRKDAIDRWGLVCRILAEASSRELLPIFIEKICSIERAVKEVLRLSYSSHRRAILDASLEVILVTIQPVSLQYDLLDDSAIREAVAGYPMQAEIFRIAWAEDSPGPEQPWKLDAAIYPHCECALLAYLVSSNQSKANSAEPYGIIGASKSWCIGCQLYFSVYNDIAEECGFSKFHISEPHVEVYPPWSKPVLPDEKVSSLIEMHLYTRARNALRSALFEEEEIQVRRVDMEIRYEQLMKNGVNGFPLVTLRAHPDKNLLFREFLARHSKVRDSRGTGQS